jgi:hypothetical protein
MPLSLVGRMSASSAESAVQCAGVHHRKSPGAGKLLEAATGVEPVMMLKRLLTRHVRADHFTYGHLLYAFESGAFTTILRRLQQLYDARNDR